MSCQNVRNIKTTYLTLFHFKMPAPNFVFYKCAVTLLLIFMLNIIYTREESDFCDINEEYKCSTNNINKPATRLFDIIVILEFSLYI